MNRFLWPLIGFIVLVALLAVETQHQVTRLHTSEDVPDGRHIDG